MILFHSIFSHMPKTSLTGTSPHSTEAEHTVIGALLLDPNAIFDVAAKLHTDDFYDRVYAAIYTVMRQLMEEGTAIDFVTVADRLYDNPIIQDIGGSAFLARVASDVPTSSHIHHYADIIVEKSRRRQLERIGQKIAALAIEDNKNADELTEMAETEFLKLSVHRADSEPVRLADLRNDRYDHYVALYESDEATAVAGLRTGFTELDDMLTAFAPGQLIVLAGRPGMGKSSMALDIAYNAAVEQKKVVAIFSLEMSKEEMFDRLFAKSLGVESWKLSKGILTEKQFQDMGPVLDQFNDYPLYICDDHNSDLVNIRSKARRHQMRHGLDLLVIDYLQLIEVTDRHAGENQTQRITHISKSLKRLARELQCPVLALSQLSRECDRRPDKRPQLSDLRDSGSIEQDGDRILMLYRESEYFEDCENPDMTNVFVRKNRHGPTGCVDLGFDKTRMTFASLD